MSVDLVTLHDTQLADLNRQAEELGIEDPSGLRRDDLVFAIAKAQGERNNISYGRGVLEVHGDGFGFLRSPDDNYLPGNADIYVSQSQIRRFKLQTGDTVIGLVRPPKEGERYLALLRVESVNGDPPGMEPPAFDSLTAIYPDERVPLGSDQVLKVIDEVAPLGLGQRDLLVAPPRTGRVDLLRRLANTLASDDELTVIVLLVSERPEEITEWQRATRAEVIATPFSEAFARHLQVADIVFERARRMVERGDDVVVLVDSLSRLARACLADQTATNRDDAEAVMLHRIRRYLGAARALEEGGSLTVVGVVSGGSDTALDRALLDDLDEVVNRKVVLSRTLADRGFSPPVEVQGSGTLREERLLSSEELESRRAWRAALTGDAADDCSALHQLVDSARS